MDTNSNTTSAAPASVESLVPVLNDRYALTASQFAVVFLFAGLALLASHLPLSHAVTWRHVLVGQQILAQRSLPTNDPTLPLADGMSWKSATWLSDVALATAERYGGVLAMSGVQTLLMVGTLLLLAALLRDGGGSKRWMVGAVAGWCLAAWGQFAVLRPALFGGFALVTWLAIGQVAERRQQRTGVSPWWMLLARPALLALWANLDASAWIGALLAATEAVVATFQMVGTAGGWRAALSDRGLRRQIWSAEAAIVATLLQPRGLGLWTQWLQFGRSSVWAQWGGIHPLVITSSLGVLVVLLAIATAWLLRRSPRPFTPRDVATLGVLALVAALQVDWVAWSVAGILVVLVPHGAAWLAQSGYGPVASPARSDTSDVEPSPLKFVYSLLSLLVIWMAFAFSPLATPLLGGKPRTAERAFDRGTPWAATRYLAEQSPRGLVFAPIDWSDWLLWEGPADLRVAWNSNIAALPPRVASDLRDAARADGNWTKTLDRYGVTWLVVDRTRQERLAEAALSQGDDWAVRLEDEHVLILKRKEVGG